MAAAAAAIRNKRPWKAIPASCDSRSTNRPAEPTTTAPRSIMASAKAVVSCRVGAVIVPPNACHAAPRHRRRAACVLTDARLGLDVDQTAARDRQRRPLPWLGAGGGLRLALIAVKPQRVYPRQAEEISLGRWDERISAWLGQRCRAGATMRQSVPDKLPGRRALQSDHAGIATAAHRGGARRRHTRPPLGRVRLRSHASGRPRPEARFNLSLGTRPSTSRSRAPSEPGVDLLHCGGRSYRTAHANGHIA
jgi:hypothetical protein